MHGKHVEAMFAALVAALGQVDLLKVEDDGDCYARDDIAIPDYRIVTTDGRRLLVEVKNVAPRGITNKFSVRGREVDGWERYANLTGADLRIALFWAKLSLWTLLRVSRFRRVGTRYEISIADAMAGNEMVGLGDVLIATVPPLVFETIIDPPVPVQHGVNEVQLRIGGMRILAGGRPVTPKLEQRLALFLMFNGDWHEEENHEVVDGELRRVRFVFEPQEPLHPEQQFDGVGFLSQMFCRDYVVRTTQDGSITDLHLETEPESLGTLIPDGYRGSALHLWRFRLSPKPEDL
jgi:hypothetical protein